MPKASGAKDRKRDKGWERYRELLIEQRREILELYEHDLKVGKEASEDGTEDIVDRANNAYNREFMFLLSGNEREILFQIEEALQRLDQGKYGTCPSCGVQIAEPRLESIPWARYCVICQERDEKGLLTDA